MCDRPSRQERRPICSRGSAVDELEQAIQAVCGPFLYYAADHDVEFHKGQILDQLKLKTTADLIKYALTHGIVSTP